MRQKIQHMHLSLIKSYRFHICQHLKVILLQIYEYFSNMQYFCPKNNLPP